METLNPERRLRHPSWIRTVPGGGEEYRRVRETLRGRKLHTVCEEAQCPNRGECWGHGTATFILMGEVCTRRCHFCAVGKGVPQPLDSAEPGNVADAAVALNLGYVVLTSVDRRHEFRHGQRLASPAADHGQGSGQGRVARGAAIG
jgi:lipoic acid synthetase